MKAFIKLRYGGPEILRFADVEKPTIKETEILVKVKSNSVNPADWHTLRGKPYLSRLTFGLFKPKHKILGSDFSGIVEKVGLKVSKFNVGDLVFGESLTGGAFAEYISIPEKACGSMPPTLDFIEMACLPIAGTTALQAVVTHGKLKKGESVLINGASGGVGHFAVQIAKVIGAEVTAVCSSRNIDFVKSLGADTVIAYDKEDIHQHHLKYDLVIDAHGNLSHSDYTRMGNRGVILGFTTMAKMMTLLLKNGFSKYPLKQFTAKAITKDLEHMAALIADGKIQIHIDRKYSHTEIPDALRYIETMRTKGKVAITWADSNIP